MGAALGEDKLPRHVDAWVKTRATRLSRGKYNSQGRRLRDSVHTTLPEMTELQKRRLIHGWGEGRSCQRQQEAPHGRGSLLCYQCQKSGLLSLGEPGLKGAQDLCAVSRLELQESYWCGSKAKANRLDIQESHCFT